jgi:fumarate reductase subunit C
MAEVTSMDKYNPWSLCYHLDETAKFWWGTSVTMKLAGFMVGVFALVFNWPARPMPFILAALTVLSEIFSYRSDSIRGTAQGLRRKLDLKDGLGWDIPNAELSDLVVRSPASVKKKASSKPPNDPYFASQEMAGPRRAIENVSESAWWSKHLAEKMYTHCLLTLIVTVATALVALIVTVQAASGSAPLDTLSIVARVVTALLMLALSLGLLKLTTGYYGLSKKAARTEEGAERLLITSSNIELVDALKIISEYHLARASAPIVPTWIWKWNQRELNVIWEELRRAKN